MDKASEIVIRETRPLDVDVVSALLVRHGLVADESARQRVGYLLSADSSISLIAEHAGRAVGCLLSNYNGFHVFLSHIVVEEKWRRQGVGRRLHDELLERARKLGALGIIADSWLTATGFYYHLGYRLPGAVFLIRDVGDR